MSSVAGVGKGPTKYFQGRSVIFTFQDGLGDGQGEHGVVRESGLLLKERKLRGFVRDAFIHGSDDVTGDSAKHS